MMSFYNIIRIQVLMTSKSRENDHEKILMILNYHEHGKMLQSFMKSIQFNDRFKLRSNLPKK